MADDQAVTKSVKYWITAVAGDKKEHSHERIARLLGDHQIFAFSERLGAELQISPGDWICFYAKSKGIVAHAKVDSAPRRNPDRRVGDSPEKYPYTIKLTEIQLYPEHPVTFEESTRRQLDAFGGHSKDNWGWIVHRAHTITARDFMILTRSGPKHTAWG